MVLDQPGTRTFKAIFWLVNILLLVCLIAELRARGPAPLADGFTIALAAVASLMALSRQLPAQNVLLAAVVIGLCGGLAHGLSADSSISLPFGPIHFNSQSTGAFLNWVPWTIPFIWIIALLNARGLARLILRPWRTCRNYGFRLIGLTVLLAVAFDVALEPFAWYARHFWYWQSTRLTIHWQGVSPLNFLGWALVSSVVMLLITPTLIPKQPRPPAAPDYHPLGIWLGAFLLFAIGSARASLWGAAAADAAIVLVTAGFALRGANWGPNSPVA
jgi:uncharacterized membrane protein